MNTHVYKECGTSSVINFWCGGKGVQISGKARTTKIDFQLSDHACMCKQQNNPKHKLKFQRTHFQSTARVVIQLRSCWHSALHELSSVSSLMKAEPEISLHTCTNNESISVIAQELKQLLRHTTSTTAASSSSYSSLEGVLRH